MSALFCWYSARDEDFRTPLVPQLGRDKRKGPQKARDCHLDHQEISAHYWAYCNDHRITMAFGRNLSSDWRDQTEEDRRADAGGRLIAMTDRTPLPNRRPCERVNFEHDGHAFYAMLSVFESGALAENILSVGKPGSSLKAMARDSAILASLALQHGITTDQLRQSLTRLDNGRAAGPVGRLLDLVNEEQEV